MVGSGSKWTKFGLYWTIKWYWLKLSGMLYWFGCVVSVSSKVDCVVERRFGIFTSRPYHLPKGSISALKLAVVTNCRCSELSSSCHHLCSSWLIPLKVLFPTELKFHHTSYCVCVTDIAKRDTELPTQEMN